MCFFFIYSIYVTCNFLSDPIFKYIECIFILRIWFFLNFCYPFRSHCSLGLFFGLVGFYLTRISSVFVSGRGYAVFFSILHFLFFLQLGLAWIGWYICYFSYDVMAFIVRLYVVFGSLTCSLLDSA